MRGLICALALVMAAPAAAQEGEPTAAPGSIAYGMIDNANANGVFELVHDGQVTVRHVGSGLVCHFLRNGDGGQLVLYPGLPRGDNVGCNMDEGGVIIRLYATRFANPTTLAEQAALSVDAIRTRYPDAQGFPSAASADQSPPRRATQFIVMQNGQRMFSHASVAIVGDWVIKLRYHAPAADDAAARQAEATALGIFDGALHDLRPTPNL